jgi:hypothetical protein
MALWVILLALSGTGAVAHTDRVVWAWERPETLDSLPADIGVAAVVGFIRLRGNTIVMARGRRFPLVVGADRPQPIGVVHIEIDQSVPLDWTTTLRAQVVGAALSFASGYRAVQIDMEVRQSQRAALLDMLAGLRAGLAPQTRLSMTALASWCETEHWLAGAPVDEIVPMLFRMGRDGHRLRNKLAAGGDFSEPGCRAAVGISVDSPMVVPADRRVYIFNPRPWDAAALSALAPR